MPIAMATMPPSAIGASNTRLRAVFLLQALGDPEDAAEIADILAEHDDVGVALHHHVMGAVERLDHVHDGHLRFASASASAWRLLLAQGARAAPRTRPRTSRRRPDRGRTAERAELLRLLLGGADLGAEARRAAPGGAPRPIRRARSRCCFSRATGSPSGQCGAGILRPVDGRIVATSNGLRPGR